MNKATNLFTWIASIFMLIGMNKFTDALAERDDWSIALQTGVSTLPWLVWVILGMTIVPDALRGPDFE